MRHYFSALLRRLADKLEYQFPRIATIKFDPVESMTSKMVTEAIRDAYEHGRQDERAQGRHVEREVSKKIFRGFVMPIITDQDILRAKYPISDILPTPIPPDDPPGYTEAPIV